MSKPATTLLAVGSSAWVPSSCTQLFYHVPPALELHTSARLSHLPVIVKSYDQDGRSGYYQLPAEWDEKVVVKCSVDLALPRSDKPVILDTRVPDTQALPQSDDLSHLDYVHDASIVWELMMKYKAQNYYCKVGSSSSIIVLTPLRSDTRLFCEPPTFTQDKTKKRSSVITNTLQPPSRKARRSSVLKAAEMSASDPSSSLMSSKEGHTFSSLREDLHMFVAKAWSAIAAANDKVSQAIMVQGCSGKRTHCSNESSQNDCE